MSRNGSGTYSLPAGNPVSAGTTITDTWANTTLSDIASALTSSLSKDGQTTPTGNLPMGGYKLTGLGAHTALTDSVRNTFDNGLTGSVARTLSGKVGELISVKDFGASGDGVTDDTAEIQAAIDAVSADGGAVYFPPGVYLISSSLNISADGVSLIGPNGTYIWDGSTPAYYSGGAWILMSASMTTHGVKFSGSGCSIDGVGVVGVAGNTADGIYLSSGLSIRVSNLSVAKAGGVGIRIGMKSGGTGNVNGWQINNVVCSKNGSHGVYIYDQSASGGPNANAGTAIGLNVFGNVGNGLHIENGILNTFVGLLAQQNTGYGVSLIGTASISLHVTFTGGDVEANTAGNWHIGADAKHIEVIGPSTFVPPSMDPSANFVAIISGGEALFRSVKFKSSDSSLSVYKEGDWTPVLVPASGTITHTAYGHYTKIGRLVSFSCLVNVSSVGTPSGGLTITGLPYSTANADGYEAAFSVWADTLTAGATTSIVATVGKSDSTIFVRTFSAGSTGHAAGFIQAGSTFRISGAYMAAS